MTAQKGLSGTRSRQSAPKRPGSTSGAPLSVSATGLAGTRVSTWRLWFPAEPCDPCRTGNLAFAAYRCPWECQAWHVGPHPIRARKERSA